MLTTTVSSSLSSPRAAAPTPGRLAMSPIAHPSSARPCCNSKLDVYRPGSLHRAASSSAPPGTSVSVNVSPAPLPAVYIPTSVIYHYRQLEVPQTAPGISLVDITPQIRQIVKETGLQEGCVHVLSRHTTTAVTINESEARLLDDVRQFLSRLAPADHPYLHNDLHMRPAPDNWPGGWAAWADQEPRNAHSHLLSMLLGNSLTVPVTGGQLALGTWQSVMLVELDGPRPRTVGLQFTGCVSQ